MLTGLRRRSSVICIVGVPVFHVPARPVLAVLAVDAPHPASIDRSHIRRIEARIPLMTPGASAAGGIAIAGRAAPLDS
jgi:hypothetical protein